MISNVNLPSWLLVVLGTLEVASPNQTIMVPKEELKIGSASHKLFVFALAFLLKYRQKSTDLIWTQVGVF